MKIDLLPEPKNLVRCEGTFVLPTEAKKGKPALMISYERARPAARVLAKRLGLRITSRGAAAHVRLRLVEDLDFADNLRPERRTEAYRLDVSPDGVELAALTTEGLLRASATLLQMAQREKEHLVLPCATIEDWPDFRYRGAADWLVNVECNRWAYDWADGREAFLERVKRKLDFCFEHKINLVWFDGFGWDTKRFPGYSPLMRTCNRYARRLGIKLEFGGYGGGYGTAYQSGEIYRCGYFGKVFQNRRSYPDGKVYACRGWPDSDSRLYGTCLSNARLRREKLKEMKRFVSTVNPGFMYIHEIDAGHWLQSEATWKQRCNTCRKRWPNDRLDAEDGQAGAVAEWFRQVQRELSALPAVGDYLPARDLLTVFVSPLYTEYTETRPKDVWNREKRYYACLSKCLGPEQGLGFGFREMFYQPDGKKKAAELRTILDRIGNGHGIHVISFGGGDNYISDDLTNTSGAMAHFFDGAESACLSNGGMPQGPVQLLNASFLWNGAAAYRETPANEPEAKALFQTIAAGEHKPQAIFARGAVFDQICVRLWGKKAGRQMSRALQTRHNGQGPVSHVWWSITQTLGQLKLEECPVPIMNPFNDRRRATLLALRHARKAAEQSDDEDIRWFIQCLEVGEQFSRAMERLFQIRKGSPSAAIHLKKELTELRRHIRKQFPGPRTDILGGDTGCWLETVDGIECLAKNFANRPIEVGWFSDFIVHWQVSGTQKANRTLTGL